ncbi:hypothetical protein Hypma_007293 [Hypsizygus marmoreus]|uniref:AC transposase n=1 Tax=Hypsizygus marmoreus TaxID=39966 RepID=A0A369KA66_HYPMA|nr:hypothetical protein Hypma_007293 [Hypsizygus marmoreus]
MADAWTADNTKAAYLGLTAHWIEVKEGKWKLQAAVVGFQAISGTHAGNNLRRYLMGLCDRMGITDRNRSKLYTVTLDNTSSNGTSCEAVEEVHDIRNLEVWSAEENQLPCFGHVINLVNVDVMGHIMKIAAVETATAIWEYDPSLENNRVLNGSLDAVAALRTVAVKRLQIQCGISEPLKIPLHSNIRWGTAHNMLEHGQKLRQPLVLFVGTADELFGPITTIRRNGRVEKHIPWSAFKMSETDWQRINDAKEILAMRY